MILEFGIISLTLSGLSIAMTLFARWYKRREENRNKEELNEGFAAAL